MTYEEIYRSKLMSAEDAVESQVKSGDKIAIGGLALADKVLKAIDKITSNIEVVVTVSANADELPADLKKYVI